MNPFSVYISYLIFQLWSHTHLYQDSHQPSAKLPVAASVHSATARLREKSSSIYGRVANARSLENFRRGSFHTIRNFGHHDKSPPSSRAPSPGGSSLKPKSPSEISGAAADLNEPPIVGPGSFLRSHAHTGSDRSLTSSDGRLSPFTSSSQVTLSNPIALPGESTVRLVSKQEQLVIRRESSSDSDRSTQDAPHSRPTNDVFDSDEEPVRQRDMRGRSRTPISDVLSAYYSESLKGNSDDGGHGRHISTVNPTPGLGAWHGGRMVESPTQYSPSSPVYAGDPGPQQPEMSWPLILFLLTAVTVVRRLPSYMHAKRWELTTCICAHVHTACCGERGVASG